MSAAVSTSLKMLGPGADMSGVTLAALVVARQRGRVGDVPGRQCAL